MALNCRPSCLFFWSVLPHPGFASARASCTLGNHTTNWATLLAPPSKSLYAERFWNSVQCNCRGRSTLNVHHLEIYWIHGGTSSLPWNRSYCSIVHQAQKWRSMEGGAREAWWANTSVDHDRSLCWLEPECRVPEDLLLRVLCVHFTPCEHCHQLWPKRWVNEGRTHRPDTHQLRVSEILYLWANFLTIRNSLLSNPRSKYLTCHSHWIIG